MSTASPGSDDQLSIKGDLATTTVPDLLRTFLQNRETGRLVCGNGVVTKQVFLQDVAVTDAGSQNVCPSETIQYVLRAIDAAGKDKTAGVKIVVLEPTETPEPTAVPATAAPTAVPATAEPTAVPTAAMSVRLYGRHGDWLPADQKCTDIVWETTGVTEVQLQIDDGGREGVGTSGSIEQCFNDDRTARLYFKRPDGVEEMREVTIRHEDDDDDD